MRRTQLYLDDDLWKALHSRARQQSTTVSELMRQAARQQYLGTVQGRREAMQAFVGIRKHRALPDSTRQVRSLRRGFRLNRLSKP